MILDALTASGEFLPEGLGHQSEAYSDQSTPSSLKVWKLNNNNNNGQRIVVCFYFILFWKVAVVD